MTSTAVELLASLLVSDWICRTCLNEYPDTEAAPASCPVCADERQFVPPTGQRWTDQDELAREGWTATLTEREPDLWSLVVSPELGIGQHGLLLRTGAGNLLWDPPGVLDDYLVERVRALGGVSVLASSHPHLVGASVRWSRAFGGVPVLKHAADRGWITRPDPALRLWADDSEVLPGVRLVHAGGHVAGSALVHWSGGAEGRGVLLVGDTLAIGADLGSVFAMRSYVNGIPLPEPAIRRIVEVLEPYAYDRLYGAFGRVLAGDARARVRGSLDRYLRWLRGEEPDW